MLLYVLTIYFFAFAIIGFIRNYDWLASLFKKYVKPFLTWRILVCYLPFWFLATGWAWLFSIVGKGWIKGVAIGWLAFLWLPCCPEKLITIPLSIWLHTKLFPKHSIPKTLTSTLEKEKSKLKNKRKDNSYV